ncbi:hypothetical protein AAVH_17497 [Aphelenchoides avenae]|nr:hypothetical protein AAVH_33316 [Aphelenchus avenae]KAH7715119.1 hypothetical protein AAVH_17497 [Aphelenchus avenae]
MLPVETLTDIVALFKYFDTDSLLLTNKQFSDLARQVIDKARIQDFSGFDFVIAANSYYYFYPRNISFYYGEDGFHSEEFSNERGIVKFVKEAFRHLVIGTLAVYK